MQGAPALLWSGYQMGGTSQHGLCVALGSGTQGVCLELGGACHILCLSKIHQGLMPPPRAPMR